MKEQRDDRSNAVAKDGSAGQDLLFVAAAIISPALCAANIINAPCLRRPRENNSNLFEGGHPNVARTAKIIGVIHITHQEMMICFPVSKPPYNN